MTKNGTQAVEATEQPTAAPAILPYDLPPAEREQLAAEEIEVVLKKYRCTVEKLVIWPNEGRPYAEMRTKAIG